MVNNKGGANVFRENTKKNFVVCSWPHRHEMVEMLIGVSTLLKGHPYG